MTIDQVDRIVRGANPVPDLAAFETIDTADLHEPWRKEMQTHDRIEVEPKSDQPKRGMLIGVAAAAVAVVMAALVFMQTNDQAPLADEPPVEPVVTVAPEPAVTTAPPVPDGREAVAISSGFMAEKARYDIGAVVDRFAPDARVDMGPAQDLATVEFEIAWTEASGLELAPAECEWVGQNQAGTGDLTRCVANVNSPISDNNGRDPGQFTFEFEIVDGMIVSAVLSDAGDYSIAIWEPFQAWIVSNRSSDHDSMYASFGSAVKISDESLRLWKQYTAEYAVE